MILDKMKYESGDIMRDLSNISPIDESVMTCDEFMLAVAYQCEANMHAIDMAIAGTEYMALRETGQEMVWEGAIGTIIDKAKQGVQWLWEHIQKFFRTVIDVLKKWHIEHFLKKYEDRARGVNVTIKSHVILSVYKEDEKINSDGNKEVSATYRDVFRSFDNGVEDFFIPLYQKFPGISDKIVQAYQISDEKKDIPDEDKFLKEISNELTQDNEFFAEDPGETGKKLLERCGIKGNSQDAETYFCIGASACDFLANYVANTRLIREAYDENKKKIDKDMSTLKKYENTLKDHKVFSNESSKAVHAGVRLINKTGQWLTSINRAVIKALNVYAGFAKKVIVAAATLKTRDDDKNNKNDKKDNNKDKSEDTKNDQEQTNNTKKEFTLFDNIEFYDIV